MTQLLLGIEGGATRTTGVIADADLRVAARFVGRPTNLYAVSEAEALAALTEIVAKLLAEAQAAKDSIAAAALCMAGVRTESDAARWRQLAESLGLSGSLLVIHDAAAGLAAGSPDATGVLAICGTGSLVYARRADGAEKFVGGRGPLLGDEGSGFDIGHCALRAALRSSDGRGPKSRLETLIPERLGLAGLDDLVAWASPLAKDHVAGLAPIVFEAAASGDAVATGILEDAAEEIACAVVVAARALWPPPAVPERVVFSGGVLRSQVSFRLSVTAAVVEGLPGIRCGLPEVEGAVGAARLARLAGRASTLAF